MTTTTPIAGRDQHTDQPSGRRHAQLPPDVVDPVAGVTEEQLGADLRQFLGGACFPAGTDELQATLIRHRAPTRLLWLVAGLPFQRRYASLTEVLEDLGAARPPELPREPF